MSHSVNVKIANNTDYQLTYVEHKFYDGGFDGSNRWPKLIGKNTVSSTKCCKKTISIVGCSGWVKYALNGVGIYFCFSNPMVGKNEIEVGDSSSAYKNMSSRYPDDIETQRNFYLNDNNKWLLVDIGNTSGLSSEAFFSLQVIDLNKVDEENVIMSNVHNSFNSLSTETSRKYYKCDEAPAPYTGLFKSHFKGLSFYKNKILLTHTNLGVLLDEPGKYLIANNLKRSSQGRIEATYKTTPDSWSHPCSSQACGSFMAMGIQKSASGKDNSEIQIFDIRNVQVNQPAKLLGAIKRENSVNGVALTKECGADGKYIIAAGEGKVISIYKSTESSLLDNKNEFNLLYEFNIFEGEDKYNASGSGLALITQADGSIFLISLNDNEDGGHSKMNLYKIDTTGFLGLPNQWQMIASRDMPIDDVSESIRAIQYRLAAIIVASPIIGAALSTLLATLGVKYLNSSFRWGKGLRITSSERFEVYATDRNVLPLSKLPIIGSNKDFSLVVWNKYL